MNQDRITDEEFEEGCQFLGIIAIGVVLFLIVGAFLMWVKL